MVIEQFLRSLCEIRSKGHGDCTVMGVQNFGYSVRYKGPGKGIEIELTEYDYGCTLNQLIYDTLDRFRLEYFSSHSTEQVICKKNDEIYEVTDIILKDDIIHIIVTKR
jgi:hypothetical protein